MYNKPMLLVNDDLAEGVYADSGSTGGGGLGETCYTTTANITQTPETGRENYCIHVSAQHHADHTKKAQTLTLVFNQVVNYVSSQGSLQSGSGTSTLVINYNYHQNPNDNIGLGDVYVTSGPGLTITGAYTTD